MRNCTFVHDHSPPAILPALTSLDIRNSSLDANSQTPFLEALETCGRSLGHLRATLGSSSTQAGAGSLGYGLVQWPRESELWARFLTAIPCLTSLDLSGVNI